MLSLLSVSSCPETRLRHRCSSWYLRISPLHQEFQSPLQHSSQPVSNAGPVLSTGFSHPTWLTAYELFTPNKSGQRSPPTYYRGCWHVVGRGFLWRYRHFLPSWKWFTNLDPSSHTRCRCVKLSFIAQYSLLQPPVGVWAVSQSQCGWSSSQTSYPSLPWWAFTPPTSW